MSGAGTATSGLVTSITQFVDSQVEVLAIGAFQALGTPGSTLWVTLTGFLTFLVAALGYNLLLGQAPSLRSGVLTLAKVGMIMALATSWPAYQTLIYNLVVDAPGQLASEIGSRSGIPGTDGSLTQRLDVTDAYIVELAIAGPGPLPTNPQTGSTVTVAPTPFASFNAFALGGARIMFLVTALGCLVSVRIVAGLMLALAPFFVAFLMFANTRSLFEGWIRVVAGAAIGSLSLSLIFGLQLLLLEPWLAQSLDRRVAGQSLPSLPSDLFIIMSLFTIVLIATLWAVVRLCGAFRLATIMPMVRGRSEPLLGTGDNRQFPVPTTVENRSLSRSERLADHISATQLRERSSSTPSERLPNIAGQSAAQGSATSEQTAVRGLASPRAGSRRTSQRVSASTARRETAS